jgi:two-component system nitrogen regulation sensor histidine kinase NtrY
VLFEFGLLYLGFALIMILAAIWLGLWFAERLSRPVGRLAERGAAGRAGDLDVRVAEEQSDDEIAMLGQLVQPDDAPAEGPARHAGRTERGDRGAAAAVRFGADQRHGGGDRAERGGADRLHEPLRHPASGAGRSARQRLSLQAAVPEFGPLFREADAHFNENVQEEIKLTRRGQTGKPAGAHGHAAQHGRRS